MTATVIELEGLFLVAHRYGNQRITVQFNRTGGDLSVGSMIRASTRNSPGTYVNG